MQNNDAQYQKMIKTPIPRLILTLAGPTMVSMLSTAVYNAVDTYFVTRLGTSASGALGIVFSLMAMIQAIGFTVGMGAGSTISRLLGKKENDKAQEMASSAFVTSLVFGGVLSVSCLFFLEKLMLLLGATETILPYAMDYARYILYAAPIMTTVFVMDNLLRAEGKTRQAMLGISIGGVLNVALDPFLIFVFNMKIRGAALATAISQGVSLLILLSCYIRRKTILRLSVTNIAKSVSIYAIFLKNGIPSLFRQGLASAASIALNRVAAANGDAAVAAMSIVGKIFMIVFCTLIGFGQGYLPAAGYNYGAKEYGRVKSAHRFMFLAGTGGMAVLGIGLSVLAPWLMERFSSGDTQVREIGIQALRMQCIAMPFMPLGIACNMTFQAAGKPVMATFLAACRQGVFFLPLIFILPKFWGIMGMEAAQPVADIATFFVCLPIILGFLRKLKE